MINSYVKVIMFLLAALNLPVSKLYCQDTSYVSSTLKSLCSNDFHGRGYVNNGDKVAADFIALQLKESGVKPFGKKFLQQFTIKVNTFPGKMMISLDNDTLKPAFDYLVAPTSPSLTGSFEIVRFDNSVYGNAKKTREIIEKDLSDKFLLIDTTGLNNSNAKGEIEYILYVNPFKAKGIIEAHSGKLSWGMSQSINIFPLIRINKDLINQNTEKIDILIENKYHKKYKTNNVAGFIQGESDSIIAFTAHYDHLGQMGSETFFPGANDNGSGVSMALDLARHYTAGKTKPKYSIAFLFFSAEEVGLLGSFHFADNPLFDLSRIKFLFNLDLVGTGDDGIRIVNSSIFKKEYELLASINNEKQYLKQIKLRGEAANSDHYPFYAKGIRSFFIYTMGGISEYHNPLDRPETLPLIEYSDLFKLLTEFVERYE